VTNHVHELHCLLFQLNISITGRHLSSVDVIKELYGSHNTYVWLKVICFWRQFASCWPVALRLQMFMLEIVYVNFNLTEIISWHNGNHVPLQHCPVLEYQFNYPYHARTLACSCAYVFVGYIASIVIFLHLSLFSLSITNCLYKPERKWLHKTYVAVVHVVLSTINHRWLSNNRWLLSFF